MENTEDNDPEFRISSFAVMMNAQHTALLEVVKRIAAHSNLAQIEGLSLDQWYENEVVNQLERHVLAIGDSDPAFAAALQKTLAKWRQK